MLSHCTNIVSLEGRAVKYGSARALMPEGGNYGDTQLNSQSFPRKRESEQLGFEPSAVDPFHLYLLVKDITKTLGL